MEAPRIDVDTASALVAEHLCPSLHVREIRPLTGGMVNVVQQWLTDGDPPSLVAKVSARPGAFDGEFASLRYFTDQQALAVPQPLALIESDERLGGGSVLLMETAAGVHLGRARLSAAGMERLQCRMAGQIADLHERTGRSYGPAWKEDDRHPRWLDRFGPQIASEFEAVGERLSPAARRAVRNLLDRLDDWLGETGRPTLTHGDLWATNIMVDDGDGDDPRITAYLDGSACFREVEHELAYLLVFGTAGRSFFDEYARRHPLADGFERRCHVYWLNTMMLHVRVFGDEYLPRTEHIADQIARLA